MKPSTKTCICHRLCNHAMVKETMNGMNTINFAKILCDVNQFNWLSAKLFYHFLVSPSNVERWWANLD